MRATGMPRLHHRDHRLHRISERRELAAGGGDRLRNAVQPELDFGDDAERALRADEEAGEVVAGRGFAHPAAGADHPPVGERDGEAEHVVADGAVADRVGAGGAGRAHAADRALAAGIDREEQALVAQMLVQELAGDAGLDAAIHVGLVDLEDPGHARKVEADAAAHRRDMALERGAGAERHHRHAGRVAEGEQPRGFLGVLDEGDGVGQGARLRVLAM